MRALRKLFKKVSVPRIRNVFSRPQSKVFLIGRQTALGLKLVYSFINFVIPLPATYVRFPEGTAEDCQDI